MNDELPGRRSLDSLKKEAKRWLAALRANDADAKARLARALTDPPPSPTLRDVQHALAREHGFAGWSALKEAVGRTSTNSDTSLALFETKAQALLDAYRTGTPEAMERHYRHTWHRRTWQAMRTYVQLDLGKRPTRPDDKVDITLDDARYLVAVEHGFSDWDSLKSFTASRPPSARLAAKPVALTDGNSGESARIVAQSRDWNEIVRLLGEHAGSRLEAHGQMTDDVLDDITKAESAERLTALALGGSQALTDDGIRHLARLPRLEHLDLSGTALSDRGLQILRDLPALKTLSLSGTAVSDVGVANLAHCQHLEKVDLAWTRTGDAAIRALAGKEGLRQFVSGAHVTDAGLPLLHDLPVFKIWQGGEAKIALLSYDSEPNRLLLRGSFTDRGMEQMRGLDGLFGLNLDDASLALTAAAMVPLASLPNLGWLGVDAKDDWMPHIAAMPRLRFLGAQDTTAGDDGFVALSKSRSIEYIWGRRCHNLRTRGFSALANMPSLRGLSVSCLNVEDAGIATLPSFPALRELMPMDVPDEGYRHIGQCDELESLVLMYCRNTTDVATSHITGLRKLSYYFNSYTTITDRTPELLSTMDSLERITFDACHGLTNNGVARLARLPKLRELRAAGRQLTSDLESAFPKRVRVSIGG